MQVKFHGSDSKSREVSRGDRDRGTEKWGVLSGLQRVSCRSFQGEETRFRAITSTDHLFKRVSGVRKEEIP